MSAERGAWSAESAEGRLSRPWRVASGARRGSMLRQRAAFTLLELLAVVAIIGIMSALLVPSLQGLFSVAGRRGGANVIAGAAEVARLEAIRHAVPAFIGFANITNEEAYSALIVYRALRPDEATTNTNPVIAVSRWQRFPRGVFVDPQTLAGEGWSAQSIPPGQLPRLGTLQVTSLKSIKFDRFGRLATKASPVLRVGEGILNGSQLSFIPTADNYYELAIQPLTGKAVVSDPLQGSRR
jgi:prepilin-type N-terminal cleavage/methylation domain-containing protein